MLDASQSKFMASAKEWVGVRALPNDIDAKRPLKFHFMHRSYKKTFHNSSAIFLSHSHCRSRKTLCSYLFSPSGFLDEDKYVSSEMKKRRRISFVFIFSRWDFGKAFTLFTFHKRYHRKRAEDKLIRSGSSVYYRETR